MSVMWRIASIEWWVLAVLGVLFIGAAVGMLVYPDSWIVALGFADRVVVQEFSFCVLLIGAVCFFAAEAKPHR